MDVALRVFAIEEQQLGDDQVCDVVVDGGAQENDSLLEQQGIDIVGPLTPVSRLHDHRDKLVPEVVHDRASCPANALGDSLPFRPRTDNYPFAGVATCMHDSGPRPLG